MADRKIMLDPADEAAVTLAASAVWQAMKALDGIDMRRYAGPKKEDTKDALRVLRQVLKEERAECIELVRASKTLREEMF